MRQASRGCLLAVLVTWVGTTASWADSPGESNRKARPSNRLARETSPYLLMHAHNPVDWYPWGPEAFAKAKKENKLVFLSIGYSSCYWCHVMERECFENAEVAKLLNNWFVAIKVDREERPDIDNTYMTALHVLGNNGGWPLSMFLMPDAKPIIGGTYWPPEDREIEGQTMRGFKSILKIMHQWQTEQAEGLQKQATTVAARTAQALVGLNRGNALVELDRKLVTGTVESVLEEFDKEFGGFSAPSRGFRGPKFPTSPYLELLVYQAGKKRSDNLLGVIGLTLDRMAQGGIYDQIGGGFHRYSTERTWTVPHFEKMLYDNAQLVEVYAKAFQLTNRPLYRQTVQETLAFVEREMTSPEGGFYSALDAETKGEEGRFYVWSDREIDEAAGSKADVELIKKVYGASQGANFESKYHILVRNQPLAEIAKTMNLTEEQLQSRLTPLRQKLLAARSQRPLPFRDTKILTGWNGEMIAGYAVAGRILKEPLYVQAAERAANFILQNLRDREGRLLRSYGASPGKQGEARLPAFLDDYAYLVHGLLCLHDATGAERWLTEAKNLTDAMARLFGDSEQGGFFLTASDQEHLFARAKDQYDAAQPCGNSMAAQNLVRLWQKTGEVRYRQLADQTFKAFAASLKTNPSSLTALALALALELDGQETVKKPESSDPPDSGGGAKRSDNVVKIEAQADKPNADGRQTATLNFTIDKGWHLYANPVPEDFPGLPVVITLTKPKLDPKDFKVEYPKGKLVKDALVGDYWVYEGKTSIKTSLRRAKDDSGPVEFSVRIQACTEKKCLLPATVQVKVP
jgi:uncharacterized protein YyaL (SSP411 family)